MAMEATHSTFKNDQREVTHYDILVDGAKVGTATKTPKGLFNFKVQDGAGQDLDDVKTMRDLKIAVLKNVPRDYVTTNKPDPKPRAPKKAAPTKGKKAAGDPLEKQLDATDHKGDTEGDIDLT